MISYCYLYFILTTVTHAIIIYETEITYNILCCLFASSLVSLQLFIYGASRVIYFVGKIWSYYHPHLK